MKPRDGTGTLPLCSNATSLNDVFIDDIFIDDVFSDASEVSAPLARIRASNEPRVEVPEHGDLPANVYRRIREELETDGLPSLNLASFVTTSMEDKAEQLALDCMNKNIVNAVEYPQTEAIHQRIIRMIARLFHADLSSVENVQAVGTGAVGIIGTTTVGSSEAVMLALLAHKWNWKNRNTHCRPRSTKDRPYLLIGTHTHACFAKFARFFDVAVKWVYLQVGQYSITAAQVKTILDTKIIDDAEVMEACGYSRHEAGERRVGELVMAVGCVAGSTFTGDFDDFEGIDRVLTQGDWNIPIHVDAASGGFIIPFSKSGNDEDALLWDFRLPHVKSINVSNHKYGLIYPGLGTVVFRDTTIVPKELLFDIDYLCGTVCNFGLSFSRSGNGVVLQYYNFLRLGKAGYRRLIQGCLATAHYIACVFQQSPIVQTYFEVISKPDCFPMVVFRFKETWSRQPPFALTALAQALNERGWSVPVYRLPPHADHIEVIRIVVRANFSRELASAFLHDLEVASSELAAAQRCRAQRTS